ncbi:MAG: hypothetical protein HY744_26645 [Deltaproteobacteria bacterium]|nr:hypothetical protein [Deltaproteobacteria bacterium]
MSRAASREKLPARCPGRPGRHPGGGPGRPGQIRAHQPRGQGVLAFRRHGGARPGAGRKPKGPRSLVSHLRRPAHDGRQPVHVTLRIERAVGRLRLRPRFEAIRKALGAGAARFGLRLVHYSVQDYHLHLLCEASDRRALGRGVQGLAVRLARALNRLLGRRGKVCADRDHGGRSAGACRGWRCGWRAR